MQSSLYLSSSIGEITALYFSRSSAKSLNVIGCRRLYSSYQLMRVLMQATIKELWGNFLHGETYGISRTHA